MDLDCVVVECLVNRYRDVTLTPWVTTGEACSEIFQSTIELHIRLLLPPSHMRLRANSVHPTAVWLLGVAPELRTTVFESVLVETETARVLE